MSLDPSTLTQPQLIVANGVAYLGLLSIHDTTVRIQDAMALGSPKSIEAGHLRDYMAAAFSGKLSEVSIGSSTQWSSVSLDEDLGISWEIAQLSMKRAITLGPINSVLDAFRKMG